MADTPFGDWKPIDLAPRDGTPLVVNAADNRENGGVLVVWKNDQWLAGEDEIALNYVPTKFVKP